MITNLLTVILQPNCLNSFAEMTTPININVHCGAVWRNDDDFHAGRFMRTILQEMGRDVPMQPLFMQRVEEAMFGKDAVA